jgi:hypothetical protein
MKVITVLTVWLLSVVIVIVAFNALPDGIRWWVGAIAIVFGGVLLLRSWWKRQEPLFKQRTEANAFEYLAELVKEHEEGIRDNRKQIEVVIDDIEKKYDPSVSLLSEHEYSARLYSARLAIDPKLDPKRLQAKLSEALKDEVARMKRIR